MIATVVLVIILFSLLYFLMSGEISPTDWWRTLLTHIYPDSSWLLLDTSRFEFYRSIYNRTCSDPLFVYRPAIWKRKCIVVKNSEEAKVFKKLIKRLDSRLDGRPMLKTLFHENNVERWEYLRKILVKQVFSPHHVAMLLDTMHSCALDTIIQLKNNKTNTVVEVVDLSRRYINKILARCVFGHFQDEHDDFSRHCVKLRHEESTALKKGLADSSYFSEAEVYFKELIEKKTSPEAILSLLKECFFEPNDKQAIQSNAVSFILGGFTSTASTLIFSLYELASNPRVQDKLLNQLNKNDDSYLNCVLKEVLRKYPPFPVVIKESESNTWVLPISGLHHDPRIYGEDSMRFNPDRFAGANRDYRSSEGETTQLPPSDLHFCPFGIGKRKCPGEYFANTVVKVFIKKILEHYHVQPPFSQQLKPLQFTPNKFTTTVSCLNLQFCENENNNVL